MEEVTTLIHGDERLMMAEMIALIDEEGTMTMRQLMMEQLMGQLMMRQLMMMSRAKGMTMMWEKKNSK